MSWCVNRRRKVVTAANLGNAVKYVVFQANAFVAKKFAYFYFHYGVKNDFHDIYFTINS